MAQPTRRRFAARLGVAVAGLGIASVGTTLALTTETPPLPTATPPTVAPEPVPPEEAAPSATPAADGWIRRDHRDALLGPVSHRSYVGVSDGNGGCAYKMVEFVAGPTNGTIVERELAQNLTTCELITEVGRPSQTPTAAEGGESDRVKATPTAQR